MNERRSIARSPRRPIPRPTRIGAPGTAPKRRSCPTRTVAEDLERSAARAQARGGFAAAAAFLERSAALTIEPARRASRALAAAQAKHQAGAVDDSVALLEMAEIGPLDDIQLAQAEVLRARIAFATNRGSDAPPLLLAAARRLEKLDLPLARETYLDALTAALFNGRLAGNVGTNQVADTALAAPPAADPRATDLLLDGLATLLARGPKAGTRPGSGWRSRPSCAATSNPPKRCAGDGWPVGQRDSSGTTRDGTASPTTTSGQTERRGCLAELVLALTTRVGVHLMAGETLAAAALIEEADALARATGGGVAPRYGELGAGRSPRS